MKFELGAEVKDRLTGFKGIMTGVCHYITGCSQALVQPKMRKDTFVEARWIDIDRLDVTKTGAFKLAVVHPGPDVPAPIR